MIREAWITDRKALKELVRINFGDGPAERFLSEFGHAFVKMWDWPPQYFVYEIDGKAVGFAGMMPSWIMNGIWDFIWINVHPDHHGKGIGKALTEYRIQMVKNAGGTAIHLVTREVEFFERLGFTPAQDYYTGDDTPSWVLMTMQLGPVSLDEVSPWSNEDIEKRTL